jgi:hypothetical protein
LFPEWNSGVVGVERKRPAELQTGVSGKLAEDLGSAGRG